MGLLTSLGIFEGVILDTTKGTITQGKTKGPVKGAIARVETSGDIGSRVTATRLLAIGIFALAAKKKSGHVYLTVEGDGFDIMVEIKAKKESDARQFATKINNAAKK